MFKISFKIYDGQIIVAEGAWYPVSRALPSASIKNLLCAGNSGKSSGELGGANSILFQRAGGRTLPPLSDHSQLLQNNIARASTWHRTEFVGSRRRESHRPWLSFDRFLARGDICFMVSAPETRRAWSSRQASLSRDMSQPLSDL